MGILRNRLTWGSLPVENGGSGELRTQHSIAESGGGGEEAPGVSEVDFEIGESVGGHVVN